MKTEKLREYLKDNIFSTKSISGKICNLIIFSAIFLSILCVFLDSFFQKNAQALRILNVLEWLFTILFTLEYILRLFAEKKKIKFVFSFFGIIDLLSTLPTYLSLFMGGAQQLAGIRVLRILRALRFLKKVPPDFILFAKLLKREKLLRLFVIIFSVILITSSIVWMLEKNYFESTKAEEVHQKNMVNLFDSVWWGFVTFTTTGYGDISPTSVSARIFAIILMLAGIVLASIFSGTITSILVDLKLKEAQGLKELKLKNHLIMIGWNSQAERLLKNFNKTISNESNNLEIVLLNELNVESISEFKSIYETDYMKIYFVKGQPTSMEALKRANIGDAKTAIVLADTSSGGTFETADEKTIIVAAAIKDLAPKVKIVVQLNKSENITHLKRYGVEDVIIESDFSGYLLTNAPFSPGIPMIARELMTYNGKNLIHTEKFPGNIVGRKFSEASQFFLSKSQILIGVLTTVKEVGLNDIAGGSSGLDAFIKEKFGGFEKEYFGGGETISVNVNPGPDYLIQNEDAAFVITAAKVEE